KFPAKTVVGVGSKVTWTNMDEAPHTVSSMHGDELKSGNFGKGESYSHTFTKAGTFMYVCDVHPDMKGEIDVK
ncbi:MAG: Blue (Type 1) copper protein, partial [Solirubrobacterales bacterium]|nr:Blue (Type 1) copper protein [Solirubrobacterales bacterium]